MRHNYITDGSIRWMGHSENDAAEDFDLGARRDAIYEWVRQLRGGVIAGVGEIERNLDLALTKYFLGEDLVEVNKIEAFSKFVLDNLSFERKCQSCIKIFGPFEADNDFAGLKSDLNALRQTRNALAHRPFWLELMINDEQEIFELCPMFTQGGEVVPLTTAYTEALNSQITKTIELTRRLTAIAES